MEIALANAVPTKRNPTWNEAYIPPRTVWRREKEIARKRKKRTKIIERYNVGIKSMGPLANKTHEIVLNYKTGEEGSKWKTNAAKDTNDKKKKNTPPP